MPRGFISSFTEMPEVESVNVKQEDIPDYVPTSFDDTYKDNNRGLIKYDVINRKFNMGKLLKGKGYDIYGSTMYCPFHPDSLTGKPSAKYHKDSDTLYCFSESKCYTAYHALKLLYNQDMEALFTQFWNEMSDEDKDDIRSKYDTDTIDRDVEVKDSEIWDKTSPMLDYFRLNKIDYKQLKNGLYKTFIGMVSEKEEKQNGA